MDLKQLRYFTAVVEQGSVSAAARVLFMSQPPLSTQIRQLEEELGCRLFDRDGHKLTLTGAGKLLYERAEGLLEMAESMEKELRDFKEGATGTLRLGAVSSICSADLPGWLQAFHRDYPGIRFELSEQNTYQLLDQLRSHRIDLAIIRTPFSPDGLEYQILRPERMMAVGRREIFMQALSGKYDGDILPHALGIADLAPLPLMIYRRWEATLSELLRGEGIEPDFFCVCDDARTVAALAQDGMGIGVIPDSSAGLAEGEDICRIEIDSPSFRSSIVAAVCRGAYVSSVARLFLSYLPSEDGDGVELVSAN